MSATVPRYGFNMTSPENAPTMIRNTSLSGSAMLAVSAPAPAHHATLAGTRCAITLQLIEAPGPAKHPVRPEPAQAPSSIVEGLVQRVWRGAPDRGAHDDESASRRADR